MNSRPCFSPVVSLIIWLFSTNWGKISIGFDIRRRTSPYTPIVIIARFRQHYDVAERGRFLQWGPMRKFFTPCWIWMKFRLRVCLKPSNDQVSLSLIELDVTKISPKKFCLHWAMRRTNIICMDQTHIMRSIWSEPMIFVAHEHVKKIHLSLSVQCSKTL